MSSTRKLTSGTIFCITCALFLCYATRRSFFFWGGGGHVARAWHVMQQKVNTGQPPTPPDQTLDPCFDPWILPSRDDPGSSRSPRSTGR